MNQSRKYEKKGFVIPDNHITVAKSAGFCFGVKRAVELMDSEIEKGGSIYSIGELIHNRIFNERLKKSGVKFISREGVELLSEDDGIIFIRAHGEKKEVIELIEKSNFNLIDATCPFVTKIHKIVSANSLQDSLTVIAGDSSHPEVEGIMSNSLGECVCFTDIDGLKRYFDDFDEKKYTRVILVAQTTFNINLWQEFCDYLKLKVPDAKIYDTICSVTEERQSEAQRLARESDIVIVVGSPTSSNTKRLYEIAKSFCDDTILIETAEEIKKHPLSADKKNYQNKKIGITAGASTPYSIIQEVIYTMTDLINEELSFAEMLERTFKTLNQGERVTGVISAISPAEIHVDLGIKHTGVIPFDEIADDSSVDLMEEFKAGDKVEAIVVKFNDSEGTVLLSKKRIDAMKNWEKISDVFESEEIIEGKVKEAIKGGFIVIYDSIRVFVPLSQSGVPMGGDVNSIVGKTMPLKIIEVNRHKKRVIGSIRQATRVINKKLREEFFEKAEVGQKFTGTVRSIVPYGVFVDLGGVDGMVHISQLTWTRIKDPSEVVSVGESIDVYIREIDTEKKRISLGCKLDEDNPWLKFEAGYKVGDIVDVKIVNLFPFGAFAEIIPGVDGLIHISQASDRQLKSVAEVFTPGDIVKVRITAIKNDAQKVSLSVRSLLEGTGFETNFPIEVADVEVEETEETTEVDTPVEEIADGAAVEVTEDKNAAEEANSETEIEESEETKED